TMILTAAYATRAWLRVFWGPAPDRPGAHEAPVFMRWPMLVLSVPAALVGYLALAPAFTARILAGGPPGSSAPPAPTLLHFSTAVVGTLLVLLAAGAVTGEWHRVNRSDPAKLFAIPLLVREFHVDRIYELVVVRPVLVFARGVSVGDRDVIDAYVRGAGR